MQRVSIEQTFSGSIVSSIRHTQLFRAYLATCVRISRQLERIPVDTFTLQKQQTAIKIFESYKSEEKTMHA
jgi:hypothetical protein